MGVILKICPGEVLLFLPVIAFRLLREFFFRYDWIAYLVPMGCNLLWLLLATPSAISFLQHWPTQPILAFASNPLPRAPLSFPICASGLLPLALLPGVHHWPSELLVDTHPFHLHCFILFHLFCVLGVLPCIDCKCVRVIILYTGSQPREWKSWRWEHFFHSWSPIAGCTWTFTPLPASPSWDCNQRGACLPCGGALWHRLKGCNYRWAS